MGCSSCGTAGGKVSGCQSNGGCSTGGCNRMNAYDWLQNLPISSADSACRVVEISFNKGSRKDYFRNSTVQVYEKGEMVTVEGVSGFDVGEISLTGEVVRIQLKKKGVQENDGEMKKLLRRATDKDLDLLGQNKAREAEALIRARAISKQLNLAMKISEVEIQADGRKATFFYIADDRVDFRELIKIYAKEFKVKVEMRQIGARQEAAKVGGIGSCGRELCCSTWLTDFKSVNTTAARYQNLSINQSKLSGQCGRLKCCLNYELDTYLDALQGFPDNADTIQVAKGTAILIKKDIFKNLMWYILPDSSKQYPLSIDRVKKIKQLNHRGEIPQELEPADLSASKVREVEPEYADLVGQISLKTLEKAEKKKKYGGGGVQPTRGGQPQQRAGQQPQQKTGQQPQQKGGPQREPREPRPDGRGGPQQKGAQGGGQQGGQGGGQQGGQPREQRPQQQRPNQPREGQQQRGQQPRQQGDAGKQQGGRAPQGERQQGDRPQGDRQQTERPQPGDRPQGDRPQQQGQRPQQNRGPQQQKPQQQNRPNNPNNAGAPDGERPKPENQAPRQSPGIEKRPPNAGDNQPKAPDQ